MKKLLRYSFDREGSWAANDGKWYWRKDVLELENALEQAEAEKERLKALIEEILVENVGCTELRDLYRRKVRGRR